MNLRRLTFDAARALPVYPRLPLQACGILALAWALTALLGIPTAPEYALLLMLTIAVPVTAWWIMTEVLPAQTTHGIITRRGDREQRAGGVASLWDVWERASCGDLMRRATILRPSLRDVHPRRRRPASVGVLLATTGFSWRWGQQLWVSCEDTTLRVGGPRTGKTLSMAAHGLDAPGALITTSTRLDLAEHVHQSRSVHPDTVQRYRTWRTLWLTRRIDWSTGRERAVHIFNPAGFGKLPSTVRWSILVGCEDFTTASRRAADLIPASTSVEGERWDRMARLYLPILLHAAALAGCPVSDVLRWIREIGGDEKTVAKVRREVVDILARDWSATDCIGLLNAFLNYPDRTRGSVTGMMTPALAWMADPAAREIGDAPLGTITLDIPRLIRDGETLHIIGQSQVGGLMAPLTSALAAEIAHQARQIASEMPGGRLDPPMTMLLDEAAVAVRLPLDEWSADMGGRGITLHMGVQSLSQLEECWGAAGAGTLLGNVGALLMFGGGKDADELAKISALCGERRMRVVGEDIDGARGMPGVQRGEFRHVPVLSVAQISNMPPGTAAVLKRNLGGVFIGNPPQVINRKGWKSLPLTDTAGTVDGEAEWADVPVLEQQMLEGLAEQPAEQPAEQDRA